MKKVLFTAIAMVAFSSVSMANTAEDKSVLARRTPCQIQATIATNLAEEEYHNAMADQGVDACWDSYTYNYIYALHLDNCNNG